MNRALKMSSRMLIPVLICLALLLVVLVWGNRPAFTERERLIINKSDSLMYVTVLPEDSVILRTVSIDLGARELRSPLLRTLMDKMLYSVQDPSQDGVGIAAPQVGINRRIVCVQRLDKDGEPFECYPNIRIDSLFGPVSSGPEGCLSVPGMRGMVPRHAGVVISYVHPETLENKRDTVEGFTAVIFQHECDHLDGILYIDRADTVYTNPAWIAEREAYSYEKPAWW